MAPLPLRTAALSAELAGCGGGCGPMGGMFDYSYYDLMTGRPFREGTISEAPVLPGAGLFVPPGTAASKDKGLFRRTVPSFLHDLCTGCLDCALVCPDAAIPNTVFEIDELLRTGIKRAGIDDEGQKALLSAVEPIAEAARASYLATRKDDREFADIVSEVAVDLLEPEAAGALDQLVDHLRTFPVSRTRVLRRGGEEGSRLGRPVRGDDRPVEVHRLSGVRRGLRAQGAARGRPGRGVRGRARGAVRLPGRHAQHAGAVLPFHGGTGW